MKKLVLAVFLFLLLAAVVCTAGAEAKPAVSFAKSGGKPDSSSSTRVKSLKAGLRRYRLMSHTWILRITHASTVMHTISLKTLPSGTSRRCMGLLRRWTGLP